MSSFPAVAEFNFTSTESEDLDVIKNETKSIQLRVTKASQKNRQNYTCLGETGYTSGYTTFQTFVGGKYKNRTKQHILFLVTAALYASVIMKMNG